MTTIALMLAGVAVGVACSAPGLRLRVRLRHERPSDYVDAMERETVVLNLHGGTSIRGVLYAVERDVVVLRHAAYLGGTGSLAIDGEACVPREKVEWIQRVAPPGETS